MYSGLQQGDLIAKVSGQQVTTAEQVAQLVANSRIGESLSFTVQRGSQTIPVSIRPAQRPTTPEKK